MIKHDDEKILEEQLREDGQILWRDTALLDAEGKQVGVMREERDYVPQPPSDGREWPDRIKESRLLYQDLKGDLVGVKRCLYIPTYRMETLTPEQYMDLIRGKEVAVEPEVDYQEEALEERKLRREARIKEEQESEKLQKEQEERLMFERAKTREEARAETAYTEKLRELHKEKGRISERIEDLKGKLETVEKDIAEALTKTPEHLRKQKAAPKPEPGPEPETKEPEPKAEKKGKGKK